MGRFRLVYVGVVVLLAISPLVAGDTVETVDGRVYEGAIVGGIPERLEMQDAQVEVTIQRDAVIALHFMPEPEMTRVRVQTGEIFEDSLPLRLGPITIRTDSGETEIPIAQVQQVTFPRREQDRPDYPDTVHLADGRSIEGRLARSFPDSVRIEESGITSSVRTDSMASLEFGDPAVIVTTDRTYEGTLVDTLPPNVELETSFGSMAVALGDVERITLTPGRASYSATGLGIGGKLLRSVPFLIGNLRTSAFDFELGVSASTMGLSTGSVTALWFAGSMRYRLAGALASAPVTPYVGVGAIGLTILEEGITASALGTDLGLGIEAHGASLGLPVALFGGLDYIFFGDLTVSIGGISLSVPIGISGFSWHVGLRWDF